MDIRRLATRLNANSLMVKEVEEFYSSHPNPSRSQIEALKKRLGISSTPSAWDRVAAVAAGADVR